MRFPASVPIDTLRMNEPNSRDSDAVPAEDGAREESTGRAGESDAGETRADGGTSDPPVEGDPDRGTAPDEDVEDRSEEIEEEHDGDEDVQSPVVETETESEEEDSGDEPRADGGKPADNQSGEGKAPGEDVEDRSEEIEEQHDGDEDDEDVQSPVVETAKESDGETANPNNEAPTGADEP